MSKAKRVHYTVSPETKPYKKYYGFSSVPTTWHAHRVRFKEFPKVHAVVYRTKSGWLVSFVFDVNTPRGFMSVGGSGVQIGNTAYRARAGVGGYGYGTKEEAIQAFIEQRLSKKRIRR